MTNRVGSGSPVITSPRVEPRVQAPVTSTTQSQPAAQQSRGWSAPAPTGTTGPRPVQPPPPRYDGSADAAALHTAMKGGLFGAGTDEGAIFRVLQNKTPDQIASIRRAYQDHYKSNLDVDLKGELSGLELTRAQKLMSGDQAGANADGLRHAMSGLRTDKAEVQEILSSQTAEQTAATAQRFQQDTGRGLNGELGRNLSGAHRDEAQAALAGNKVAQSVAALRKAMDGAGTDEAAIFQELQGKTPAELQAIKAEFAKSGRSLEGALGAELSGTDFAKAKALLSGAPQARVDALDMKAALGGVMADRAEVERLLDGATPQQRRAMATEYKALTGKDLRTELGRLSGNFAEKATTLFDKGSLSDAERLHFALAGAGTDEDAVKSVLSGKSKQELAAITADYQKRYKRDLAADLGGELSGREAFDAQLDLQGAPQTAQEALQRANARREYERGGVLNLPSRALMDLVSDKGARLDQNTQRANDFYNSALAENQANGLPASLTPAQEQRLGQLLGYAGQDVASYREAKDTASEAAATVATTAAVIGVSVATAGTATPLAVAGMAAAAGAGARVVTKAAIDGKGYGLEEAATDGLVGAVDGATAGLAAGGASRAASLGRAVMIEANAGGLGNVAGGVARRLGDEQTYTREGLQNLATGAVTDYALGAVVGGGVSAAGRGVKALRTGPDAPTPVPAGTKPHAPNPHLDPNADGITDAARVGVAGNSAPTKVPRLANLSREERLVEQRFADAFERNPDAMARELREKMKQGLIGDHPNHFSTDEAKLMSPDYAGRGAKLETLQARLKKGEPLTPDDLKLIDELKTRRAIFNVPTHQTANALVKRAFLQRLDELAADTSKQHTVLITAGGVGAGKSYAIKNVARAQELGKVADAVWDSAGEQCATELPWLMAELQKRNIKGVFVFVHNNPTSVWQTPGRGVVARANDAGRMVDARLFADSYPIGAKNFEAFRNANQNNPLADFVILDNRTTPVEIGSVPDEALRLDTERLYEESKTFLQNTETSPAIQRGGWQIGERVWGQ